MTDVKTPVTGEQVDVSQPAGLIPMIVGILILGAVFAVVRQDPLDHLSRAIRVLWGILEYWQEAVDLLTGVVP